MGKKIRVSSTRYGLSFQGKTGPVRCSPDIHTSSKAARLPLFKLLGCCRTLKNRLFGARGKGSTRFSSRPGPERAAFRWKSPAAHHITQSGLLLFGNETDDCSIRASGGCCSDTGELLAKQRHSTASGNVSTVAGIGGEEGSQTRRPAMRGCSMDNFAAACLQGTQADRARPAGRYNSPTSRRRWSAAKDSTAAGENAADGLLAMGCPYSGGEGKKRIFDLLSSSREKRSMLLQRIIG
ncbi:oligopeptide transporter 4 [Striga asiatica]|uniref:Oligopeptide transporter 4 n=1 Tax=Striga asiatica TaxID=4170 RepID=A0A5A7PLM1_STRAF|nr:oligopeptide transporter 4 [Striga asiatica]